MTPDTPDFIQKLLELKPDLDPYTRKSYIDHHSRWYYQKTLEWLQAYCSPKAKILDCGGGYGTFGIDLMRHGFSNVWTIDKDEGRVATAKQLYEEMGLDPERVYHQNLVDVSGEWDVIVSMEVLYMIEARYLQQFFHRCMRILSPGGYLIFTHMKWEKDVKPTRSYLSVEEIYKMIRRAGLELVGIQPRPRPATTHDNHWLVVQKSRPPVRELIITVDGDKFLDHGQEFLEKILHAYPLKFSVSMIENALEPRETHRDLAAEIFSQENVEVASHSWSHPQDWEKLSEDELTQQIDMAVHHLNGFLQDRGIDKRVEAFFWSGMCNPTEAAVRHVDELGIPNFNGKGWSVSPFIKVGDRIWYPQRGFHDTWWMNRAQGADWGPMTIQFYELHADRPVHIYLHFSAANEERWPSVNKILDWAMTQVENGDLESIWFSEYMTRLRAKFNLQEVSG